MKIEIFQNGVHLESRDLGEGSWKIGRAPECDVQLNSPQISKQHALLVIKGNKAAIVDLGSSNGVFVNGILVRKQRIEQEDEITIADFQFRLAHPVMSRPAAASRAGASAMDGNLAPNLGFEAPNVQAAPVTLTPQERFLLLMDQKILVPYYELVRTCDWRWVLSSILLIALVSSVLLSVIPIVRWGKNITTKESLARAHTVVSQTVRENFRILAKSNNDTTHLTVDAAESEPGILSCAIVDPKTSTILAPTKNYGKSLNDVYSLLALKRVIEGKEEQVSVQVDDITHIIAQPIYLYSVDSNDRELSAVVLATFEVKGEITSTFEPLVEAALFAVLLSLAAFFFISKMFTHPVIQMHDQLDAALKGEGGSVDCPAKMPELQNLATVINFALSKIKNEAGVSLGMAPGSGDLDGDTAAYVQSVEEFDQGTSDALVLLDKEKKVKYVGRVTEDLIGMRNQYAKGQNISDACRDSSFAGTAIDLADNVFQSLGEMQGAQLDINGTSRNIVAVAHRSPAGEIVCVLITVKMGTV